MRYCFGNLNFGGQLTEEFMGGEDTTDEEKMEMLDFMESFSELWNKALKK